ncbi:MAG TPA: DUF742 domain-containing protein [Microthrixaceae bacterium]|nr:DUF742 domain-containing protein [Microthrixaceae bacterium]
MEPWNPTSRGDGASLPEIVAGPGPDPITHAIVEPDLVEPNSAELNQSDFDADDADGGEDESLVRPFVITGGRTRHARVQLRVEALVVVTDVESAGTLQFEHAQIVELCQTPISVAEVGARIGVPLGVAQILVGDLADAGLVRVHEATSIATPALLLRMIDAVRAL